MVTWLFRVLFFVSAAVASNEQANEHSVLVVGKGTKEHAPVKQGFVSKMKRVKQVLLLDRAVILPIVISALFSTGAVMLLDRLYINKKKVLQSFALMFLCSVAGSCGGFLATRYLPTHSVYKTTVAALATLFMPICITYDAVKSGLLLCFR